MICAACLPLIAFRAAKTDRNRRRQIGAIEERIFWRANTRWIGARAFIVERAPLCADVNEPIADNEAAICANDVARSMILDEIGVRMIWTLQKAHCGSKVEELKLDKI